MTAGQQRRVIAVSAMLVFAMGFLYSAHRDEPPSARLLIGIGFTYTFISVVADLGGGDFAAGLAILVMITAIIYEGEDLINLLESRSKGEVKAIKRKRKSSKQAESLEGTENLEGALGTQPIQRMQRLQRSQRLSRR